MRASGALDVLIYCRNHNCSHHIEISADRWTDHVRLSDVEPDFVCTACGKHRGRASKPKELILDGEAVLPGVDGRSDFNGLHSRKHDDEVQFYAFDILVSDSVSIYSATPA